VPGKADPLSEENHIIFSAGPASGTNCYYSSKSVVSTKSPLSNIYLFSLCSSNLSHQIKQAGFWAIDIKGIAEFPTYIVIDNREVEFRDATSVWGLKTHEAHEAMLGNLQMKKAESIVIGPAGEALVTYAAIMTKDPLTRAFGRGGAGCVMGAKKLKGLIINGDGKVSAGDITRFDGVKKAIIKNIERNKKWAEQWHLYGTGADLEWLDREGIIPTRNWQGGQFEGWRGIDTSATARKWPRESHSCASFCPTPCAHYVQIKKGQYKGVHCSGPEYETIYAFGSQCGINKFDAISAAGQICDEYGIDTISAGVSIGFAMECFEKGLIGLNDTDGIELRFGNDRSMIAALMKIVNQEGFGCQLSEGVKSLSKKIPGSEAFAMHAKGLELGGYECRGLMGQALEFAISNRGGCHHAYGLPARTELPEGSNMEIEGKGEQVKNLAILWIIRDCIPMCGFPRMIVTNDMLPDIVSSLFGEPWSLGDLKKVGMRIICQERLFNMREGITRKDDTLPPRLLYEAKPDGRTKGVVVPLENLKDDYYRAMAWDISTGNPTNSVLKEFGLQK